MRVEHNFVSLRKQTTFHICDGKMEEGATPSRQGSL